MKIGVLTHYYRSLNYGGMLQAYALATYLHRNGYDAEQICYAFSSEPFQKTLRSASPISQAGSVSRLIRRVCGSLWFRIHEKPRLSFYDRYKRDLIPRREKSFAAFQALVPHSVAAYTPDTVAAVADRYDCLITGSDQVWNFDWFNPAFFLDFPGCHANRIAYAASAGRTSFNEAEADYLRRVLPSMRAISVRETDLAGALNEIIGTASVATAVDPTLLLSAKEWKALASPRLIRKKYLFCYFLHNDKHLSKLARSFARKRHLRIATIPFPGIEYNGSDIRFGSHRFDAAGPAEFLSLILNADYVLTDSFHATVFSLLFERPFAVFPRGDAPQMGSRLQTLTELFGCPERFCTAPAEERCRYVLGLKDTAPAPSSRFREMIRSSESFLLDSLGKE